ncbi:MAG: MATE family efflux transporter [Cloacibacillus sp.]
MKTNDTKALGTAPIGRLLVELSIPAMAGMFMISLYNVADAFFVGRGVGPLGIASVFISFPATLVVMAVSQTFGVGGGSVIARALGAGDAERAGGTLGTIFVAGAACSLLMTALLLIFLPRLLEMLGAASDMMEYSLVYGGVIFLGTPVYFMMMVLNNLVRGEGNTRLCMYSMMISSVLNILLDPLFIFVFHWGVAGAAWATVLSQICALVWLVYYYASGKSAVPVGRRYLRRPSLPLLWQVLTVGASAFVRQVGIAISWTVLNRIFSSTGGSIAVASSGLVQRILSLIIMPVIGMGHGLLPLVGYNYGANNFRRVLRAMRLSNIAATVICCICAVLLFIFPRAVLALFSNDEALLSSGAAGIYCIALGLPFAGAQVMVSTYYQGTGSARMAFFLSMLRPLLLHPPLALALSAIWGVDGAWASFAAADIFAFIISWAIFMRGRRELKLMFAQRTGA